MNLESLSNFSVGKSPFFSTGAISYFALVFTEKLWCRQNSLTIEFLTFDLSLRVQFLESLVIVDNNNFLDV